MAISRLSSTGGSQSFNFIDYLHNKGTDTSYPAPQPEEPIRATRRYRPLLFTVASSRMSVQEMFECLIRHGCTNLSSQIDSGGQPSSAIAGGGFGDIYRGRLRDGTTVAIKALRHHLLAQDTSRKALKVGYPPPGARLWSFIDDLFRAKRAMRELYVWSKTKHENVQQLLGVVVFQGHLGMVSPWMDNGNLEEYIRKYPGADRYGLRNVLVDRDGMAKLSDFDHSILSNCTLSFTETTNVGGGTLRWMAPELLLSDDDEEAAAARTTQTDVYALGMTLLHRKP
ncbi:hypothetical protein FRC10_003575 [Ceratobasidium sp. 414]|nr:hypothetical protein FRC10_003575 [Ceratobasidium sp. 414]